MQTLSKGPGYTTFPVWVKLQQSEVFRKGGTILRVVREVRIDSTEIKNQCMVLSFEITSFSHQLLVKVSTEPDQNLC